MAKTPARASKTAGSNGANEGDDARMDIAADDKIAAVADEEVKPSARPTKARKRRREKDENEEVIEEQGGQKSKRTRLMSPNPNEKEIGGQDTKMEADDENGESEEEDADADADMEEGDGSKTDAKAAERNNAVEPDAKAATKVAKATKPTPAVHNLRVPSHQTPGKFAQQDHLLSDLPTKQTKNEMPVPSRRLKFSQTPTASVASASDSPPQQKPEPTEKNTVNLNGGSPDSGAPQAQIHAEETSHQQQPPPPPISKFDLLSKPWFWFLVILALHVACYPFLPKVLETSTQLLHFYKGIYYNIVPPPKKRVVNETFVNELTQAARKRQEEKRQTLKLLQNAQKGMIDGIEKMQKDAQGLQKEMKILEDGVKKHRGAIDEVHSRVSRIDKLLLDKASVDLNQTIKSLPEIKKALGESDEKKLLDLSTLDLWIIPEMPSNCTQNTTEGLPFLGSGDVGDAKVLEVVDHSRLKEWLKDLEELVNNSTDEILKSEELSNQVRAWIQSEIKKDVGWDQALAMFTVEELGKLIKKEKAKATAAGGSLATEAILSQIQERLELEIADQTGRFDYALIRNGASVIREGPRATSRSLVDNMPFFNRLLAHVGLRFYGHGAEAALTPTDPPDALGQCWSFLSEEAIAKKRRKPRFTQDFSRGSVATLSIRLARPTYVRSVVIEHPPREITDRIESAIRIFRVIGYEDALASRGSYELGRFEYKIDRANPRMEFSVAKKLSRQAVPKLQSLALAIESTWGGSDDYGCLYRVRVHGDDNE